MSGRGLGYAQPSTKVIHFRASYLLLIPPTGQVLLTVGTGERVHDLGDLTLLPLHSYAVIGMSAYFCSVALHQYLHADIKDDENRTVTVVNPWRERQDGGSLTEYYSFVCSTQFLIRIWRLGLIMVYDLRVLRQSFNGLGPISV